MIAFLPVGRVQRAARDGGSSASPLLPFVKANQRSMALVFAGLTAFSFGLTAILAWTPVSLTRIFGLSAGDVGMVLGTVIAVTSVAGVAAGNFIMRYFQRPLGYRAAPRIIWVSLIVSVPVISLIPIATAPWQVFVCVGVQAFASTIAGASMITLVQDLAPPEVRARIMALRAMTNGPAIGLGVAGSAFLADHIDAGAHSLFWGGWCLSMPMWILCVVLLRLAEKPFEITARNNTGLFHPLDLVTETKTAA
jgi:MFS family permease